MVGHPSRLNRHCHQFVQLLWSPEVEANRSCSHGRSTPSSSSVKRDNQPVLLVRVKHVNLSHAGKTWSPPIHVLHGLQIFESDGGVKLVVVMRRASAVAMCMTVSSLTLQSSGVTATLPIPPSSLASFSRSTKLPGGFLVAQSVSYTGQHQQHNYQSVGGR